MRIEERQEWTFRSFWLLDTGARGGSVHNFPILTDGKDAMIAHDRMVFC